MVSTRSRGSRLRPTPPAFAAVVAVVLALVHSLLPTVAYPYESYDDGDQYGGGDYGAGAYDPYDRYAASQRQSQWTNVYRQRFYYQCPPGQVLSELWSEHSSRQNEVDRLWGFQCRPEVNPIGECFWEEYNRAGLPWYQLCSDGAVVAGVQSNYFEAVLDREWQFYCCRFINKCPYASWMNQDVPNYPGQELRFSLIPDFYIRGAATTFSPVERDRQWKFVVSRLGDCPVY